MGDQPQERKIGDLCTPNIIDLPILNLAEIGRLFEIKTSTIRMVQHSPFTGKEDPNLHLQAFIQLCQTFNMDGVTQDQMRARLFLFSLLGKALQWFHSQPAETVQDWNALMWAFIKEYYSPGKTQSLRNKIATFAQYPTETISKAFECFNEYTQAVPRHKFPKEDLVQKFYQGLTMASRTIIDASAGGSIIELTPTEAFTLFKKVVDNDMWASSGRLLPVQPTGNVKGVLQVEKENKIKPHWILFRKFFRVKPQPSASNPRVVGGAGIQMREDAAEQYLSYKLIDSNQDWKVKWFYVTNHHPELPKPSGKQPKHRPWWNSEPMMQEGLQLPELLAKIKALREAGLRAEHVAFSFMKRRVQPLMARDTLGYEYTGDDDTSQMPGDEVDDDDIVDRLGRIFKDMPAYTPCPVPEFSAARPPNKVSCRSHYRVLITEE
jgi:hypothetical protein